jgi:hypothetical protein
MSKLTVVYLKDTGHVLAALTRADPSTGDKPVSALVGAGLPVSAIAETSADVTLSAQDLAAATVDDDQPEVLINPQNFQVVPDPQGQGPPQVKNIGAAGQVVLSVTTSGAKVTVTNVPSATSLPAVVVLQNIKSPSVAPNILSPVTVTVGPGGTVVSGSTGFAEGDTWKMFAFVQGLPPAASGTKTL